MRSIVALVEARPETILDDYRRVLELAKLLDTFQSMPLALIPQAVGADWTNGAGTAPWQLDGVLSYLSGNKISGGDISVIPAVKEHSLGKITGPSWSWDNVLASHGAGLIAKEGLSPVGVNPSVPVPALGAVLSNGFTIPAALQGRRPVLLPVPFLNAQWAVAGAVSLLKDLLLPSMRRAPNIPFSEVVAELISFVQDVAAMPAVVLDATLWQIPTGSGAGHSVARNVLLAGTDPVAVDAVAIRLAGLNPMNQPWLRLCQDRGLGAVAESEIKIVGRTDLLELDFDLKIDTLPSLSNSKGLSRWGGSLWRKTAGRSISRRRRESVWGRLFEDYRDGRIAVTDEFGERIND